MKNNVSIFKCFDISQSLYYITRDLIEIRILAGLPSVSLNLLICSSMLLGMGAINRVACNILVNIYHA